LCRDPFHPGVGDVFTGAAVEFHLDEEFGLGREFVKEEIAFGFGHGILSFQTRGA
jgi:hypothetical protein